MSLPITLPHLKSKQPQAEVAPELPQLPKQLEAHDSTEVRTIYHAWRWCGKQALMQTHPDKSAAWLSNDFHGHQNDYLRRAKNGESHLVVTDAAVIRAVGLFSLQAIETPDLMANLDMTLAPQMLAAAVEAEHIKEPAKAA